MLNNNQKLEWLVKKKVFIIAEAGVNHNGSIDMAKQLIDVAADAGADAVKFQTFKAEKLLCENTEKAEYQKKLSSADESQFEMIKKLELDVETHKELIAYCEKKGILFLSTPFDLDSINLLNDLELEIFKIPSGEITNLPYLRAIGLLKKKVILSTGMSVLEEVKDAFNILVESGTLKKNITILHANTEYPTPFEDVNLKAMCTIRDSLDLEVGYSDHTLGIEVPIAAVAMGATVIEKHFTLDRNLPGPDHRASIEPAELNSMVSAIRNIELAMGKGIKKPSTSEKKNIRIVRKSIVAKRFIQKGELFTEQNITTKRPWCGLSPMKWDDVVGSVATKEYLPDEAI